MQGCTHSQGKTFSVCPVCGALLTPPDSVTDFEIFGEEPIYFIDKDKVQKRFYELSRILHPDRFQSKSEDDLIKATHWFARVNGALLNLKNDDDRAQELFRLYQFTARDIKGALPPDLAEDYFTLQETLEEPSVSQTERAKMFAAFKAVLELKLHECDLSRDVAFREWQDSGKPLEAGAVSFFERAALAMNQKAYLTSMLRDLEQKCQKSS